MVSIKELSIISPYVEALVTHALKTESVLQFRWQTYRFLKVLKHHTIYLRRIFEHPFILIKTKLYVLSKTLLLHVQKREIALLKKKTLLEKNLGEANRDMQQLRKDEFDARMSCIHIVYFYPLGVDGYVSPSS